nr:ATP-binding protein [Tritonibacter mobilis]
MEMLDHTVQRLERGEIGAIDSLLSEEPNCREDRRVGAALTTARLTPPKTLENFDFTFQPSLDRDRIMALRSSTSSRAPRSFISSDRLERARAISPPLWVWP